VKKILFLTGTRADYGKLKPLIEIVEKSEIFECYLFVTGMHTLVEFGDTKTEIIADNYSNLHIYMNQIIEEPMDLVLANTINGFSRYIRELLPDLIIVHGDRIEALAAAISGAINNMLVGHVEGGEVSGTIDESLRHAISKLAHIHFVSNNRSRERLIQLGEKSSSIFVIGSPDIDIIKSQPNLTLNQIRKRYDINFTKYAILIYHPVTTELSLLHKHIKVLVDAVIDSNQNYIVINPNNDTGYKIILDEYKRLKDRLNFKVFPSIRFEYFIELLKNSSFIIGNSSVGIHESPSLGIPTVNVGSRQNGRLESESILNVDYKKDDLLKSIQVASRSIFKPNNHFGEGDSSNRFIQVLNQFDVWNTNKQKEFVDFDSSLHKRDK
jgi:UDP-N-acetylglucosamine 2-epimerase (hydrolysing)